MTEKPDIAKRISAEEAERRIKAWADITLLSLELKRAALRQRHPGFSEDEISELVRRELSLLKTGIDEP